MTKLARRKIRIAAAAAFIAAAGALAWTQTRTASPQYRPITVVRGEIRSRVLTTGVIQPENRLEIKPPIAGRVETILVQEGRRVRKGEILAWMSSTERAALLDAARARGPEESARWEEYYKPTPVLAPIHGTIISRKVEPGQTFTSADALFVMSDRLTVKAQIDETDIGQIRLKQDAEIVLDAYADKKLSGRVDQIAFEAKTVNNVTTYVVDVLPDESPDFMRSGMTANVTIQVAAKEGALLLPAEAVKSQDGVSTVLLASGRKPEKAEITLGLNDGKQVEVLSGLSEGDQVLIPLKPEGSGKKNKQGSGPFSPWSAGGGGRKLK